VIYLLAVLGVLFIIWTYHRAWHRGFDYGYAAGLIANDRVNITFEEKP
jgi:hypothetical protein